MGRNGTPYSRDEPGRREFRIGSNENKKMSSVKTQQFDVIVIGGGHAGVEAALAAARTGANTLLLTQNIDTIGQMSCNPAIGGIGKGHLVKEIDALGGIMAKAADKAGIQFRRLNARKGPAVRATRAQSDRVLYKQAIRQAVESQPNLSLFQQSVEDLMVDGQRVVGVKTKMGLDFHAKAVVLTVGTFLGGKIHIGFEQHQGGRAGCPPSIALADRLRELPFRVDRLKTGTPPRLDGRTINYSVCEEQPGDTPIPTFSYLGSVADHPRQVSCHITRTTEQTHEIIRANLDKSPMYAGVIEGVGPRYCPSIEDKVVRFAEQLSHQIFIEPEGLNTFEVYPNGISTSLPFSVQMDFVRSIKGFENVHITRPGYAIEYDYFDPRDLKPSLETKAMAGLFFAGQINGTTGYEEAGAQGLIAGLNAARLAHGKESWTPRRDQAYLGVLIDDLITCGTLEPYRMFTSRAEYRLLLREDNADLRLTEIGRSLGLVDDLRWESFNRKCEQIEAAADLITRTSITPESDVGQHLAGVLNKPLEQSMKLREILKRPEVSLHDFTVHGDIFANIDNPQALEQAEIQTKYAGYIERQQGEIDKQRRNESLTIPIGLDFNNVSGLSSEVKEKLNRQRPTTLGIASRIPGVTPAAVSLLLVHIKKKSANSTGVNDYV